MSMQPRVLVIDDEDAARYGISRALSAQNYAVDEASDGREALEKIAQFAPDVIVSDINMPGMSGLELLPKAKAARPDVPVIMITAYGDAETKRKALENGADALFTKPIDFVTLRSEIETRVERAA